MSYATIDDLRVSLGGKTAETPQYRSKMLHQIPAGTEVDRNEFILNHCRGKRVVEFGASGPLHDAIVVVARAWLGVDRESNGQIIGFDLDDVEFADLPMLDDAEVIVCGEVLEHLANPGHFLARLRREAKVPVIISVPNAFTTVGAKHLRHGYENVNIDHVAWYSPRTLTTLLARYRFTIREFHWYNGNGPQAEGMVVVAE
jgi:hypothetical protein